MPKGCQNGAKMDPKWTQNRCQKLLEINAKTDNEKDQEIIKNYVSLNGKNIEVHYKNKCF